MNTTSAVVITSAADGGGSNVCELVPSGTTPVISAQSPMTFAAIEVIGATVVTTRTVSSAAAAAPSGEAPSLPQPNEPTANPQTAAVEISRRSDEFGDMVTNIVANSSQ